MSIESIAEVKEAVQRAEYQLYRAEACVKDMAYLCAGRLRSARVSHDVLVKMKRELADYNIHTKRWKS